MIRSDPQLASYTAIHNTAGRPLAGSPVIDAGVTVDVDGVDLLNSSRNLYDVGAFAYQSDFGDTIYVSPTGDNVNMGRKDGSPIATVKYAISSKTPATLEYPVVIRLMPGTYREDPDISVTGKG